MKMLNHDVHGNNGSKYCNPLLRISSQSCMSGVWGETHSLVSPFVFLLPSLADCSLFFLSLVVMRPIWLSSLSLLFLFAFSLPFVWALALLFLWALALFALLAFSLVLLFPPFVLWFIPNFIWDPNSLQIWDDPTSYCNQSLVVLFRVRFRFFPFVSG